MTSHEPARGTSTRARVREVFGSAGFRRLFSTRTVSQIGDGIFQLATADLLLFSKPGPNPALTLTILSVVTLVPFSIISPFVGVFIDRFDRRKILEIVPVVRAAFALLIGLGVGQSSQGPVFYVIVLVVLSANRLFLATIAAVLPTLVPADDLLVANSAASTGGSIANVLGLGVGAGISALIGGTRTAGVAAIAFTFTALLARKIPAHRGFIDPPAPLREEAGRVLREMADGIRRLRASRRASFALGAVTVNQICVGAMTAAIAVYFISDLRLKVGAVSSVLGVLALGIGIGVVMVPALAQRIRVTRLIPLAFLLAAVTTLTTGATLSRASLYIGSVLLGLAYAMTKIPVDTIVQEEIPDSHRGRAFAAYDMLFNIARVAGTAACAAAVAAEVTPATIVLAIGATYTVTAVVAAGRERVLHRSLGSAGPEGFDGLVPSETGDPAWRSYEQEQIDPASAPLVLTVGELVTVRAYAGHRADSEPRAIVVAGREIPIEAIEWRAVEERVDGLRRLTFLIRAGGSRLKIATGDESDRWEVERLYPPNISP